MELTFNEVTYTYSPGTPFEFRALENLSLHVPSGSYTAIIGHTGSGKSTLIQHINALLQPTSGSVKVGDFVIEAGRKNKNLRSLREKTGIVFQYPEHQLFEETVEKDIAFGPKNFGVDEEEIRERVNKALEAVQLPEDMKEKSPFDLSGGQMRRVAIAGVLAMKPKVLVLDEPTAGLDPRGQKEMMDMFYSLHESEELTTVLVTHSMEDALTYADEVVILNEGRKYMEGAPLDVFKRKEELRQVQLDIPEVLEFLEKIEKEFGVSIEYDKQPLAELAKELTSRLGRRDDYE
ncbi:energy-coupling factor transporter ATPase [Salimicrobium jeotgali]|uniref:Energy-coupling factor transporter ATP-binding protein EcfA2 n=1 Tax=Salimicrobium jeotgali TaxID=1230341 RepID=K2H3J1_9BACI|nr:energy-coupling factor ABC transporter ATP-binding protein [Salimicrobium jeotgali]AKG05565.1 energy-coupling factor transporter ATPase [Salimicrobium jeotgali]EKE30440.1 cobalt/nickel ABC transporter ATP-binding protein [Salimicrobium jeotgali]MBM7696583.1 energy-coupling factor transport system ATP-binding protein [Salimicrobium jeotgali]